MAIFDPNLSIDGDLGQATRKRTGDPDRAKRMQDQALQPVTGPRGVVGGIADGLPKQATLPTAGTPQAGGGGAPKAGAGILDGLVGGAKAVAGGAALPFAAGIDAARAGVASAVGGNPDTLPGGRNRYADSAAATLDQGLDQASGASEGARAQVRQALGVQPAAAGGIADNIPVTPVTARQPLAAAVAAEAPAVRASAAPGYVRTGVGAGLAGGEIAARRGADGVMEFTNDAGAVQGAGAAPVGGVGGIGDGIGTFSQAEAGSAKLALERFERANQEGEKMIAASRRGKIGEGGGRVTVVRDSSRAPSIADLQNARLDARQAQTDSQRSQTQEGILAGLDDRQNSAMQRERIGQEIEVAQVGLNERQRLESLQAQLADPTLSPEERETARNAYTAISTPAKDRFRGQDVILGRDENGRDIRGTQLIDVTTGRPVAGIGDDLPMQGGVPSVGTRKGGYEFLGGDPADQKNWRKV
ncbi:hypothetical protein [Pseudomonas sp. SO81]|uniref:hypothetical protein n=1 Tax=Pseudomonas sp. SO81 TaxID=2983246 RepID=UPI0025A3E7A4|nr:hypothetical protein [Pseudomonas sp. SO81]WJN61374.1 hypothetical protein OH686_21735 [Pseudomonas sp. SO81]